MDRWEYSKKQSNYHFNKFLNEEDKYYKKLTNIYEDWNDELKIVKQLEKEEGWLDKYSPDYSSAEAQMLMNWGLKFDCLNFNFYIAEEKTPILQNLGHKLGLLDYEVCVQTQYCGQMAHLHIDSPHFFNIPELKHYDHNEDKIARVFVMLQDWDYGQIIHVGNSYLSPWKAGDVFWFDFYNVPHSTCNTGPTPRPMAKITGKITPKFLKLLDDKNE